MLCVTVLFVISMVMIMVIVTSCFSLFLTLSKVKFNSLLTMASLSYLMTDDQLNHQRETKLQIMRLVQVLKTKDLN